MIPDRIISVESGGNATAKNPRSSAYGAGQFIDATWLSMLAKHRPDLTTGRSRDEILGLRSDPDLSKAMTEAYAAENAGILQQSGLPVTPGTTYLAHFAGPKGAIGVLSADPSAPVGSVLGEAAIKANPFLKGMTVADLRSWADRKMGGESTMPQASPPVRQTAPGAVPAFGNMAALMGGAPMGEVESSAMGMQPFGSMGPQLQPPPIPPPIRPQVDLSRLRAALRKAPSGAFSLRA